MLVLSKTLLNRPVMSLRTGGAIATVLSPLINPNNLKIEGFFVNDKAGKRTAILLTQDIRDMIRQGFVVNDAEVFAEADELVRLEEVIKLNFKLEGKQVVTEDKTRVGKIIDWAAETDTLYIQKLYVGRSVLKSLNQGQLSVDRSQIIEITNKKIVIQDILKPEKSGAPATAQPA